MHLGILFVLVPIPQSAADIIHVNGPSQCLGCAQSPVLAYNTALAKAGCLAGAARLSERDTASYSAFSAGEEMRDASGEYFNAFGGLSLI